MGQPGKSRDLLARAVVTNAVAPEVGIMRNKLPIMLLLAVLVVHSGVAIAQPFAVGSPSAISGLATANRILVARQASGGALLDCFLVDGSKIVTTAAGCEQSKGSPNKDKATLAECLMPDGSTLLTTGAACDAAHGTRRGTEMHSDAGSFQQAVSAYQRGDYANGLRLLRPAAGKGDARAQDLLGHVYEEGRGIPPDLAQASKWYRLAADQGLASAQSSLGDLYANGRGVARNLGEAARWYRKAAEQDYGAAETKLGEIYQRGIGVPANFDEAIKWFRQAADGDASARLELKLAEQFRDGLARYLKEDYAGAISNFQEALKLDPAFADAYDLSGWVYSAELDQRNAVISFARAADLRLRQQWGGSTRPLAAPMQVVLVRSSVGCESNCPQWISADGQIVGSTPNDFRRVIKEMAGKRFPVIIHSPGGDVQAAMAIGRLIRAAKLDVAVGKTLFDGCYPGQKSCAPPDGQFRGMVYSTNAICASACPLILAAGQERLVGAFGIAAVHEPKTTYVKTITTYELKYQIINGKKSIISKTPVASKSSHSESFNLSKPQEASLSQYLNEMGIDTSLIGIMKATPYASAQRLDYSALQRLNLVTRLAEAETLIDPRLCTASYVTTNCVSAPATPSAAKSGRLK